MFLTQVGLIISIFTLVLSTFGFITLWFGVIAAMKEDIARLVTKEEVTWAVISPHLANIIHAPTHFRRDFLMDELEKGHLNTKPAELKELNEHLDLMIDEAIENKDPIKEMLGAIAKAHVTKLLIDNEPRKGTWLSRLFK